MNVVNTDVLVDFQSKIEIFHKLTQKKDSNSYISSEDILVIPTAKACSFPSAVTA